MPVHVHVLNVAHLTAAFRRDVTLAGLGRVSVEHVASRPGAVPHVTRVSWTGRPSVARNHVHRRQVTCTATVTGRLHGPIVGPTGRSDPGYVRLSVRPVGQTVGQTVAVPPT